MMSWIAVTGPVGIAVQVSLVVLTVALLLAFVRLARGPSLPDRLVALEATGSIVVAVCAILCVPSDDPVFLDVGVVLALVVFIGAVAFARYLEKQGRQR